MADNTTFDPAKLAELEKLLGSTNASDGGGKKQTFAAPVLRAFVESGELYQIVDMAGHPNHSQEQMIQHFKNAGQATKHNVLLDCPEYVIPGGYHVTPVIINGQLTLVNETVRQAMVAAKKA